MGGRMEPTWRTKLMTVPIMIELLQSREKYVIEFHSYQKLLWWGAATTSMSMTQSVVRTRLKFCFESCLQMLC
jgi:hypothetical protein